MNDFDQRWQKLAREAGSLLDEALPELPFGFTARVLARAREPGAESWEEVFNALGLRAVLATAAICLIAAAASYSQLYEFRIERPALERAVTSDLPWP